jgi:hypothetical protein
MGISGAARAGVAGCGYIRIRAVTRGFAHFCGLTWILGFGGMLAAVLGRRDLAGMAWLALGAGSVGVVFDRATAGNLHFDAVQRRAMEEAETSFLVGHLPFLVLGLVALTQREAKRSK